MTTDSKDRWNDRASHHSTQLSPIEAAAINSNLLGRPLIVIGELARALNACEMEDPDNQCEPLGILPYSATSDQTKALGGHANGLAVWSNYSTDEPMLMGVLVWIDTAAWHFVPASAMPQADRTAVIALTWDNDEPRTAAS